MSGRTPFHQIEVQIGFGHCDAAGIVHYPNYFRWFDQCFHRFLHAGHGGHADLCARLGAQGLGLIKADSSFRSPGLDGDVLRVEMDAPEWGERNFRLVYRGIVADRLVVEGVELRGVFGEAGGRLTALPVARLRAIIEDGGDG